MGVRKCLPEWPGPGFVLPEAMSWGQGVQRAPQSSTEGSVLLWFCPVVPVPKGAPVTRSPQTRSFTRSPLI